MAKIRGADTIERLGKKKGRTTWRVRFNLGRNPVTGRYRYAPWRTVYNATKADALAALADYRGEIEGGLSLNADKMTFGEFSGRYVAQRKAVGGRAPSTLRVEAQQIRKLNRYLAEVRLADITVIVCNDVLAGLASAGATVGAVRRSFSYLRAVLAEAVRQDLMIRNPCDSIKLPRVQKSELNYLGEQEFYRMVDILDAYAASVKPLDAAEDARLAAQRRKKHLKRPLQGKRACNISAHRLEAAKRSSRAIAVHIGLATGARRGEVLGLTWGAVSLSMRIVSVVQQNTADGKRPTKTECSKRKITIDAETVERLRRWKIQQAEYLLALGIKQTDATP